MYHHLVLDADRCGGYMYVDTTEHGIDVVMNAAVFGRAYRSLRKRKKTQLFWKNEQTRKKSLETESGNFVYKTHWLHDFV